MPVRIHTGPVAAQSARKLSAAAFTVGNHIVFGPGRFAPTTFDGAALLRHELTHVAQQGGREPRRDGPFRVEADNSPLETEARGAALAARDEASASQPALHRAPEDEPSALSSEPGPDDTDGFDAFDGDWPVEGSTVESGPDTGPLLASNESDLGLPGGGAIQTQTAGRRSRHVPPVCAVTGFTPPPGATIDTIAIDLAAQQLTPTWSDGSTGPARTVSSGRGRPNTSGDPCATQHEENCTPIGTFTVGLPGDANVHNTHGDPMAWYVPFCAGRGIGIHNSQRADGRPRSHGCVRVGQEGDGGWSYACMLNHHVVPQHTQVVVSGKAPTRPWTMRNPPPAQGVSTC
jgi:hypothetical protein